MYKIIKLILDNEKIFEEFYNLNKILATIIQGKKRNDRKIQVTKSRFSNKRR